MLIREMIIHLIGSIIDQTNINNNKLTKICYKINNCFILKQPLIHLTGETIHKDNYLLNIQNECLTSEI